MKETPENWCACKTACRVVKYKGNLIDRRSLFDKNKKNCRVASGRELLTDRMGKRFPLRKTGSGCRVEILNSAPIYMADRLSQVSANVIRLLFTIETPQECVKITREYRDAMAGKPVSPPSDFTRGHFTRGVK